MQKPKNINLQQCIEWKCRTVWW